MLRHVLIRHRGDWPSRKCANRVDEVVYPVHRFELLPHCVDISDIAPQLNDALALNECSEIGVDACKVAPEYKHRAILVALTLRAEECEAYTIGAASNQRNAGA